jgi:hypothetical protein
MRCTAGEDVKLHIFLTSKVDGDEFSPSRLSHFAPLESIQISFLACGDKKMQCFCQEIISGRSVPWNLSFYWPDVTCSEQSVAACLS